MNPGVDAVLQKLAASMILEYGPALPAGYLQSSTMVIAMLLQCANEEFDRAAARRVEENNALRALFGRYARDVDEPELRARLEAAATDGDPGLRVSELDAANRALRELLIELHAWVDDQAGAAAEIESAIWQELRASTERRQLSVAPF